MRTLKDCCNEASQLHNFHNLLAPQKISKRFATCLSIAVPQKATQEALSLSPLSTFFFLQNMGLQVE
jgi:hypothetical protein